jgi:murein DD-endopeptidase MepM/ murein hydrolase activator NlpD
MPSERDRRRRLAPRLPAPAVGILADRDTLTAMRAKVLLAVAALPIIAAGTTASPRLRSALSPPVSPACISSSFGPRVMPNQPAAGIYHYGVDLPAATGAAVTAAAAGTVIGVRRGGPGGLEMLVQHDGFVGVYSHFGSIAPAFAEGKREVAAGERLGVVGMTGVTSGPHLYFEMIVAGRPVDPAPYLGLATCNGAAAQRAAPAAPGDGSVVIDGKKYWQFSLPGQQYIQWQQHSPP